jgi:hypothetical protein
MTHARTGPLGLRERTVARLWEILEWFALSILPRGPLRRRVIARVDQALARMHGK